VIATDENDAKWSGSNYGDWCDIAAPGTNIISLKNGGGTTTLTGTSMASPHVAGVAAPCRPVQPSLGHGAAHPRPRFSREGPRHRRLRQRLRLGPRRRRARGEDVAGAHGAVEDDERRQRDEPHSELSGGRGLHLRPAADHAGSRSRHLAQRLRLEGLPLPA